MQVVEEQIAKRVRILSEKDREDVLRYIDDLISAHKPATTLAEKIVSISSRVPEEDWGAVPVDGAEQHDHYLYGTRKR